MAQLSVAEQLSAAGIDRPRRPRGDRDARWTRTPTSDGQRVVVAIIGIGVLYGLLILFGQFVAQGVVEEKASRVVELLLATMSPWQLLAGKIIGLGLLGLAQIVVIAVVGVAGALAFDLVDIPGELIGTAVSVVAWFVLGYAFYASIFAVAASLVSRQEDLGRRHADHAGARGGVRRRDPGGADPGGTLAVVTSYIPGLSPLVMPVRQAAGDVAAVGDRAGRRPHAGRDRAHRPARRPDLRRRAAAHGRERLREALEARTARQRAAGAARARPALR